MEAFLNAFEPDTDKLKELKAHYRRGGLADSALKRLLNEYLQVLIGPIREERARWEKDHHEILAPLRRETERTCVAAARTLAEVRSALGLDYFA